MPPILIRPATVADAEALARVHIDTWRHAYAGVMPAAFLAGLDYGRSQRGWEKALAREGMRVIVVDDADAGVVGFASAGPNEPDPGEAGECAPYDANLYSVYIRPEYQRGGIGRALVAAAVGALLADGRKSMIVWVVKGNPACGFYERLGGMPAGQRTVTISGAELDTVAYGWPELSRMGAVLARRAPHPTTRGS